ncbi:MAG: hypothetical protein HRU20_31720 [Pseudomonadales bacterium]|nr:hypothetical protein [Pseudomonadales bacterium]
MIPGFDTAISGGAGGLDTGDSDSLASGGVNTSKQFGSVAFNVPQWPQAFGQSIPVPFWQQSKSDSGFLVAGLAVGVLALVLLKGRK